jgi:general secretion pathway protein I
VTPMRSHSVRRPVLLTRSSPGFTLIEVLVALCIMLIALVPLIQLHVASIRSIEVSSRMAAATVLANTLLAEILMKDVPEVGESSGRVEDAGTGRAFQWRSVVADADWAELQGADLAGLRRVHVEVVWQDGGTDATVSLDTVVYLSPSSEQKKSENQDGLDSAEKAGSRRSGV